MNDLFSGNDGYTIFSVKDTKFLFDIYNFTFCVIPDELFRLVAARDYANVPEKYKEMLNSLAGAGRFFYVARKEFPELYTYNKISFSLPPVHTCNFSCRYCFAKSGDNYNSGKKCFDQETLIKTAGFLFAEFKDIKNYRLDFVSGGEPLLDREAFKNTIKTYHALFKEHKKDLFIWVCTNASLLDISMLRFIDEYGIKLGISLDGPCEINDKNRVFKNGQGTYNDVVKSIKLVNNSVELSKSLKELWGLSVITSDNFDFESIVKHHRAIGFNAVQMKFARLEKSNYLSLDNIDTEKLLVNVENLLSYAFDEYIKKGDIDGLLFFINQNDYIGKYLWALLAEQPYAYRCEAGRAKFSFSADGCIYPCDSFVGMDEFCLGNINEGFFNDKKDFFMKRSVADRAKCSVCWARFVCAGDCFHNAFLKNGDIGEPDGHFCEFSRRAIQLAIYHLNQLFLESPKKFTELKRIITIRKHIKR